MPDEKIAISYDSEKLSALKDFLAKKNLDFDEEIEKAIDVLYKRHVPAMVREYISMRMQNEPISKSHRTKKQNKKKEVDEDGKSED